MRGQTFHILPLFLLFKEYTYHHYHHHLPSNAFYPAHSRFVYDPVEYIERITFSHSCLSGFCTTGTEIFNFLEKFSSKF
jgi:hypothetical protein